MSRRFYPWFAMSALPLMAIALGRCAPLTPSVGKDQLFPPTVPSVTPPNTVKMVSAPLPAASPSPAPTGSDLGLYLLDKPSYDLAIASSDVVTHRTITLSADELATLKKNRSLELSDVGAPLPDSGDALISLTLPADQIDQDSDFDFDLVSEKGEKWKLTVSKDVAPEVVTSVISHMEAVTLVFGADEDLLSEDVLGLSDPTAD